MLWYLFVVVVSSNVVHSSKWSKTVNGVSIDVEKVSGEVTISNSFNKVSFAFKELVEVSNNGLIPKGTIKHVFRNFRYQEFTLTGITDSVEVDTGDDYNISAFRANFSSKLDGPDARLTLHLLVYDNESIIQNKNSGDSYQLFNGTVKICFTLDRWPFCGANDTCDRDGYYLDVYMQVKGVREKAIRYEYDRSRADRGRRPKTWDLGGADVTLSEKYLLNHTWFDMRPDYPQLTMKDSLELVVVRFPVFYQPISYEFTVNVSNTSYVISSSTGNKVGWFVVFISSLVWLSMTDIFTVS